VTPHCLVVHPGALGDVLLAGPALEHLRALGFRTTLAVTSSLVALFAGSGLVEDARDLESLALHRLFVEPPDPGALDAVASFDAFVCWLGAGDAAFRANLAQLGRPAVVARAAPPPGSGRHASRHLVETLAPLGPLPTGLPAARLGVAEAGLAMAGAWLAARGIGPAEAVILQPGAGSTVKVWPGFAALTRRLRDTDLPLVALAGPADGSVVASLVTTGGLAEERLARDWPLPEVAALLSLARGTVGNDSGPTHLAAAVGCPTVAIFGPTDPVVWAPVGSHVRVVTGRLGGVPWADADRVEAALRALLAESGAEAAAETSRSVVGQAWP
jgi:Glycosyltransferase family 9 (heptosyltransferase)